MALKRISFTLGIFVASVAFAADPPAAHVRNFDKVNSHLFRGGTPTLVGLQELGAMGVKVDVDLRQPGGEDEVEKQAAEKLGIKYINIPLSNFSAPTNAVMERILSLLNKDDSQTVFVHCRRGKDRTGMVVACYRIQHDGWSNQRALEEAKKHGMSGMERGMRSYIVHFSPNAMVGMAQTPAKP